jgi:hypothetical protein
VIDRVGQIWRNGSHGDVYMFVRSWSVPTGTCHELISMEDGFSQELSESYNQGPIEWRQLDWQRII